MCPAGASVDKCSSCDGELNRYGHCETRHRFGSCGRKGQKELNYEEILLMRTALEQYGLKNRCDSDECLRLQYALKDAAKVVLFEFE